MKRLIDQDPLTGVSSYYEGDGGGFKVAHSQDIQPHLEYCKRLRNNTDYKRGGIKNDYYHFAHVPAAVLVEWKKLGIDWTKDEDLPKIEKLLNGPDYAYLRTVDRI